MFSNDMKAKAKLATETGKVNGGYFMADTPKYSISPLGESALTITFGDAISTDISDLVTSLAEQIENRPFTGFVESVPGYSSLTVFFDVDKAKSRFRTSLTGFEIVKSLTEIEIQNLDDKPMQVAKTHDIPVSFDSTIAPDLDYVASINGISPKEVIEIFVSEAYRVYMLGFLPGFPYMGKLNKKIAAPRKKSPRTKIAKGSVGIAGRQTGIYPLESPGGWQIIGRTKAELFSPDAETTVLLRAGDLVRFYRE